MMEKIVIIGAGPTGLGAAYRLEELGYPNFEIYERNSHVGGIASSFKDSQGFTWDIGGHVIFSHNEYFNKLLKKLMGKDIVEHVRESFIWALDRFVPYPFQNNIRYLPKGALLECVAGLIGTKMNMKEPKNFLEWIYATFGKGVAKYFMVPYNQKTWSHPLEAMDKAWVSERVSVIDLKRIMKNVLSKKDDLGWGPNSKFFYPLSGGIQGLFDRFVPFIKNKLHLGREALEVDTEGKTIRFNDGEIVHFDKLISTVPLNELVKKIKSKPISVVEASNRLLWNSVYAVGIGVKGPSRSTKNWIYFPEKNVPFYRVTYLSNYSPEVAPDGCFSLLCETSFSEHAPKQKQSIVEKTIQGLIEAKLLAKEDRDRIISEYLIEQDHAYPIPTLERDRALRTIQPYLIEKGIFSIGRFGAWKYEIGNMDHSV
ncbi:MAG: FAD-dependent oxidoreductase, partial [Candidatus Saganbacteria bacterium]|nr:FAD-dependent oxidoreductase [Candidatus Saganbacteria bacterium]